MAQWQQLYVLLLVCLHGMAVQGNLLLWYGYYITYNYPRCAAQHATMMDRRTEGPGHRVVL